MLLSPGLAPLCRRLGPALAAADFSESAVADRLGDAYGCLSRGEPGPVEAAAPGDAPLDVLIRLFLAAAPVPRPQVDGALAPVTVDEALRVAPQCRGECQLAGVGGGLVVVVLCLRG